MAQRHLFDTTVASLYETVLEPQHWGVAIANVAALFDAPTAAMFRYDFTSGIPSDFRVHGHDAEVERRYSSYYHLLDPGRTVAMFAPVGTWVADELMLDLRSLHHQEYVQDFALRSGIGRVAGCKVTGDESSCVYLSLQRPPDAERFGDAARQQYRALAPHLRRVSQMQSRLDELAMSNALARACLDRLRVGVLVVDKRRRVHLINAHASSLLGAGSDVAIRNQRLQCSQPSKDERLESLIESACGARATGGALNVARNLGQAALLLSVLPIPQTHELAVLLPERLAIVIVGDPAEGVMPMDVYRTLFSLTVAEAELMTALARGSTVAEWAARRGISVATVRTQLRSLFDKTGTNSQARLVGLAKSLPPMQ